jgi:hypothetical protein
MIVFDSSSWISKPNIILPTLHCLLHASVLCDSTLTSGFSFTQFVAILA